MPDPYEEITYGPLDAPKKIKIPMPPGTYTFEPTGHAMHYFVKYPNVLSGHVYKLLCHACGNLFQHPVHYDEGIPYNISTAAVGMTIWIPRKLLYPPKVLLMPDNLPILSADEGHEVVDWVLKKYQWAEYTITSMPGSGPKFPKTVSIGDTTIFYLDNNLVAPKTEEQKFQLEMEQAMIVKPLTKEDIAKAFAVPVEVLADETPVPVDIPTGPIKNHKFEPTLIDGAYCGTCGHLALAACHGSAKSEHLTPIQIKPTKKGKSNHPYVAPALGYVGCQACGLPANSANHMAPHPSSYGPLGSGVYDEVSDTDVSDKLTQMMVDASPITPEKAKVIVSEALSLTPKQQKVMKSLKPTPVSINAKGEVTTSSNEFAGHINHPYKNPAGEYGPCIVCGFAPISEIHGEPFGKVQNVHVAGEYPGIVASAIKSDDKEPQPLIYPVPSNGNWRAPHYTHLHDQVGQINDDCADCQLLSLMDGKQIGFVKSWRAFIPGKDMHPTFTELTKALAYKQKHPEAVIQVSWRSDWVKS